jgi:hypothetical protein
MGSGGPEDTHNMNPGDIVSSSLCPGLSRMSSVFSFVPRCHFVIQASRSLLYCPLASAKQCPWWRAPGAIPDAPVFLDKMIA